ncbi:MAG: serine/threonine protein kinase [Myxococcales bacterium]|nr:serine/threonine protein kinase [Myxococcales bacterium]
MESGQIIAGKYRLNQLLGTGGMAQVWSATNTFTERQFAIKFMLPAMARTAEAAQRFLMEAKASARINHPNIVEIMDVGQTDEGALFLVMELLSGVSLDTALRRQNPPMTIYEMTVIMLDVARALTAAHRAGVVHRDLKPTNIYLHKDRVGIAVPKVLDFGVSKFHDDGSGSGALTVAGTVLGSPLYMSPEQAMGAPNVDGRTDVFAFGGILFEALVGFRCYDAPNFNALIVTIATTQPRSIDELAPHLPESLRALVRDCLVTDKNKRIKGFEEIVERLSLVASVLEHDPARLPSPVTKGPPSDPDATNALPAVVRPSDRPPSLTDTGVRMPSGNFSAPWTPSASLAPPAVRAPAPPQGLVIGLGVLALGLAVALLVIAVTRNTTSTPRSITPATTAPVTTAPTAPPSATSVQVDSLPGARVRGIGSLVVVAQPGTCALSVNGSPLGATPVSTQLAVGEHSLKCDAGGRSKTGKVTVTEAQTARYLFTFD